jgi:hypothetical protein
MSEKVVRRSVAIALAIICILSIAGLGAVLFVNYAHISAATTIDKSNNSLSFNEPPPLDRVVNSDEEKVNDLESLGCKIVYPTYWFITQGAHVNYTDFRRMAYNSKVVLCLITWHSGYPLPDLYVSEGKLVFCVMLDGVAIYTV